MIHNSLEPKWWHYHLGLLFIEKYTVLAGNLKNGFGIQAFFGNIIILGTVFITRELCGI